MEPNHDTPHAKQKRTLVSDFDGTMTRHDFYRLAIEHLIPRNCPNFWAEYRQGRMTHFEALQAYFRTIPAGEHDVLAIVNQMELDPQLPQALGALRSAGWHVVVTSAGCRWYIDYLLARAGVTLEVYANPGVFVPGQGLKMDLPSSDRFRSPTVGVDKAGVVRHWLEQGHRVAFAGDGFPDADAAKLVDAKMRFAKSDLAEQLQHDGFPFQSFSVWSDIATKLLQ
jgi:2,3-diketo-5-methylthio-1-phosphopentane phosphatase